MQDALADSWGEISVPANVSIGTLSVSAIFKKGNTAVYIDYSRVMGFDRVIILYRSEEEVKNWLRY
ncbi:hypothetical protein [Thermococcus sp. 2319x1]|uniref:hypothetical protein n=1 Tax=Thermococcus sp. 2319x1 TaxID=1674923 RepID=UPI001581DD70|nr:hypothetical protein [Thermococcus sp. 2319x1]